MFKTPPIESYDQALSRERLIQLGRIGFIDDEEPLLISQLKEAGFSVDHDTTGDDLRKIDAQIFDVIVLDYFGVGKKLGENHGRDLLKHIRRVSPRTRVIAYTSRSLTSEESEFYTNSQIVLPKNLGLIESMAVVEGELRKAFAKEHLLDAMLQKLAISDAVLKEKVRNELAKALKGQNENGFRKFLEKVATGAAEKGIDAILSRLFNGK